ncbi:MAG: thiamine-phosphate kinase [Spirochaetales bacterium]|nr:thiamine-phosphate kinase [Spirochaetales bacterium]
MKISEIGGEFAMLNRFARREFTDSRLVLGIGDDCAVLEYIDDSYLLVTTDMMVENDHFSTAWQTPFQIGAKLIESNVSDIVCKGGTPKFAFLSMCLPSSATVEFMDGFYKGLYAACERHGVILAGGDTTHGEHYVFNLALTGEVPKNLLRLRSGARVGDCICSTGSLGASTAGLKLLLQKREGYLLDHLEPKARTASEGAAVAQYASAAIDVSDGLGSEVSHICHESNTGAKIEFDSIPLSPHTVETAALLNLDPHDFALYGGEDYEIVFTIAENDIPELRKNFDDFTVVGKILPKKEGIYILKNGEKLPVKKGYDHFA